MAACVSLLVARVVSCVSLLVARVASGIRWFACVSLLVACVAFGIRWFAGIILFTGVAACICLFGRAHARTNDPLVEVVEHLDESEGVIIGGGISQRITDKRVAQINERIGRRDRRRHDGVVGALRDIELHNDERLGKSHEVVHEGLTGIGLRIEDL